jgi:ABC-type transporter Mla subunit MlaD
MLELLKTYLHDAFIVILAFCGLVFVLRFLLPGLLLWLRLGGAARALKKLRPANSEAITDLDKIAADAMRTPRMQHCWAEFRETLHPQKQVDEYGQEQVVRWRSTALADVFFTEQALVETPLKTEFYKHLPGILTGIGIIGTFSGLIFGLMDFQISENPNVVRSSLATLVQSVGQAFILSGSAIALAMLTTWLEKSIVTLCYRQVEGICQGVDSLFDAGAGEEYLARLVTAAEESATQSAQMKDSLVTDLKQILTELTEMQIQAAGSHNQQLSTAVVGAINESLKEPMQQLSAGMNTVARDQGTAINSLLTDVLSSFTAKIDDMFGAQMRGMNDALVQTSAAIQAAAGKFDQLASGIESAGQGATEAMHQRLEAMMAAMEARQQAMNDRMAEFVEQLRVSQESSQSESAAKMQSMLAELGQSVNSVVTQLQENADQNRTQQGEQLTQLASRMGEFLEGMERTVTYSQDKTANKLQGMLTALGDQTGQLLGSLDARNASAVEAQQEASASFAKEAQAAVSKLAEQAQTLQSSVEAATTAMRGAIADLATSSKEHITQMNRGADTLNTASTRFSGALNDFSATASTIGETGRLLSDSAQKLQAVVALSNQALGGHQAAQEAFASMVDDLRATVENASRDARMTSELVSRLEAASQKIANVQEQAEHYLESVNAVLEEAHQSFADSVKSTLREGNKDFHSELGQAVGLLSGAIRDLGDTLDMVPARG